MCYTVGVLVTRKPANFFSVKCMRFFISRTSISEDLLTASEDCRRFPKTSKDRQRFPTKSEDCRRFPNDFRRLPKISQRLPKHVTSHNLNMSWCRELNTRNRVSLKMLFCWTHQLFFAEKKN